MKYYEFKNKVRNMWFPWTCHWQDAEHPSLMVRLRWYIVVSITDVECLISNQKRQLAMLFGKYKWRRENK